MKILFIEPFFGGSHKDFALGFQKYSRYNVTLVTLPDRFWKWRMRGASLYFAEHIPDFSIYDAVFATDMLNLSDLISFAGKNLPPVLFYFHENQLSYPLAPGVKRDANLGFINIISAAVADTILFNSKFHLNEFMTTAEKLIQKMPEFKPEWMMEKIRKKAGVVFPGCRFTPERIDLSKEGTQEISKSIHQQDNKPPLIIWNHRWDYDKNPEFFFKALQEIKRKKIPFSLALLGEKYEIYPEIFHAAKKEFTDEIVVYGYVESRNEYVSWLKKGTVVVSCANQENFGISVVEAVRYGCMPLLPNRLSYPEIIPEKFHSFVLYQTMADLQDKLQNLLLHHKNYLLVQKGLSIEMGSFSWEIMCKQYDTALENLKRS